MPSGASSDAETGSSDLKDRAPSARGSSRDSSLGYLLLFDSFELNEVSVAAVGSMSVRYVDDPFQILCFLSETAELTPTAIGTHVNTQQTPLANR